MAADVISLTGLRVFGRHGVLEHERREGQDFVVDVHLTLDTTQAAATDDVADTVHYGELAEALAAVVAGDPVDLIETLATRLVAVCLADDRVQAATVTVHKPNAPIPLSFADVAVTPDPHEVRRMTRAVLSIGSNLGDRLAHLHTAVDAFTPWLVAVSGVVETPPWGPVEQPDYLNAVLVVDDPGATPGDWLVRAHEAERRAGRTRDVRWGPRTLDVDVVAVTDQGVEVTSDDPVLTLPHPRAAERGFVLVPWADADPGAVLRGRPVAELAAEAGRDGVTDRPDLVLVTAP